MENKQKLPVGTFNIYQHNVLLSFSNLILSHLII